MELFMRHVRSIVLLISLIYICSGAANWGFFGYWIAAPFVLLFVYLAVELKSNKQRMFWLFLAGVLVPLLAYDHSKNSLIFPAIGSDASLGCGWIALQFQPGYSSHEFFSLYRSESSQSNELFDDAIERITIPCGHKVVLDQLHFTYPEFEGWFQPVFKDESDRYYTLHAFRVDEALDSSYIVFPNIKNNWELESWLSRFFGDARWSLIFVFPAGFLLVVVMSFLTRGQGSGKGGTG